MAGLEALNEDEFDEKVLKSTVPVLVYFGAAWCHPCKVLKPRLEQMQASADDRYKIITADVDMCQGLATDHAVTSVPACLVFKNGVLSTRFVGLVSEERLTAALV